MFEDLENTLNDIRSELSLYRQLFALSMATLSTKKQVAKFLGVSSATITKYIADGRFKEGVHFFYNDDGKEEFIPEGIVKFKQKSLNSRHEVKKVDKAFNPIARKFLNNRKVVSNG